MGSGAVGKSGHPKNIFSAIPQGKKGLPLGKTPSVKQYCCCNFTPESMTINGQ
jgi:hypothetical protein